MSKRYAIGVDLGGTNLRVAIVSEDGEVVRKEKHPSAGDPMATLKERVADLTRDRAVAGMGIGVAGLIDRDEERVLASPNVPSLEGRSFGDLGFEFPVVVENDANAAALGERWMGEGRRFKNFILMTLGTGIGGGIVRDGRLLPVAAEVGHVSIVLDGEACPCGNHGCLERYASARAITDAAVRALEQGKESRLRQCCHGNIYRITSEDVWAAALEGDALSRGILRDAGRALGAGIAGAVNLLSPEAVILSGGLIGAWDIYVKEAIMEFGRRAFRPLARRVDILPSALGGDDAGVVGAAGLVLHG
jgi:glucokinase